MTGAELAVSAFVNPVLWKLDVAPQARATRLFARRLGAAMPVWYFASLLLLVSETISQWHDSVVLLLGIATGIWVAVIVLSLLCLVPINSRLARMHVDELPESAKQEHRKWDTLHRLRIAALAVAMIFLLAGIRA